MSEKKKDNLGDKLKLMERIETEQRFLKNLPVYARIDGRGFSSFTRKMERPFDKKMSDIMVEVTRFLVKETHAKIGYTQSDEINLAFYTENAQGGIFFEGKKQKIASVLAGMASSKFALLAAAAWPELTLKKAPCFDA